MYYTAHRIAKQQHIEALRLAGKLAPRSNPLQVTDYGLTLILNYLDLVLAD